MGRIAQAWSDNLGDISSGPIYVSRKVIVQPHELVRAWVYTQKIVTTGVLEILLKYADRQGPRGGNDASEVIENDNVVVASVNARYDFVLLDGIKGPLPAERMYFLSLSATDPADRFDEPLLVLDYNVL